MSRGIEDRRVKEQLKTLARERGARANSAQLLGDTQALMVLLAETKKRAESLVGQISDAEQQIADAIVDLNAQIEDIEDQIPPVASSVSEILAVLNGGTAGQHYVKGAAALGGVWRSLLGPLTDGGIVQVSTLAGSTTAIDSVSGWSVMFSGALSAADVATATGDGFQSAEVTWTFPRAFAQPPFVSVCQVGNSLAWGTVYDVVAGSAKIRLKSTESIGSAVSFRLRAEGVR